MESFIWYFCHWIVVLWLFCATIYKVSTAALLKLTPIVRMVACLVQVFNWIISCNVIWVIDGCLQQDLLCNGLNTCQNYQCQWKQWKCVHFFSKGKYLSREYYGWIGGSIEQQWFLNQWKLAVSPSFNLWYIINGKKQRQSHRNQGIEYRTNEDRSTIKVDLMPIELKSW